MSEIAGKMTQCLVAAAAVLALCGCTQVVSDARTLPPAPGAANADTAALAPTPAAATADVPPIAEALHPEPVVGEPAISSMRLAEAPHKLGVPVDLRYQFEGDAATGQPVTLHLAAVPRVAGSNLVVSIKKEDGISTTAVQLSAQKASAATAYRQQISVRKLAEGPAQLRVLVMMEVPAGSAHSWFTIPLSDAPPAAKQAPVRLE
jgi:hypothetical protein